MAGYSGKIVLIIVTTMFMKTFGTGLPGCGDYLDSGDVYYAGFSNGIALDWYRRAYAKCPDNYDALMKMVRAYLDKGQDSPIAGPESLFITGMRFADTLQRRFPDSCQGYFLKAVAAGNLSFIRKAARKVKLVRIVEKNAKKAIELSPDFAPAYIVLGIYYREIAMVSPINKFLALLLLGGMPRGTLKDSEYTLQHALYLSPENNFALLELARTKLLMGKKKEAIRQLKRLEKAEPAWYMDGRLKQKGALLLKSLMD